AYSSALKLMCNILLISIYSFVIKESNIFKLFFNAPFRFNNVLANFILLAETKLSCFFSFFGGLLHVTLFFKYFFKVVLPHLCSFAASFICFPTSKFSHTSIALSIFFLLEKD